MTSPAERNGRRRANVESRRLRRVHNASGTLQ